MSEHGEPKRDEAANTPDEDAIRLPGDRDADDLIEIEPEESKPAPPPRPRPAPEPSAEAEPAPKKKAKDHEEDKDEAPLVRPGLGGPKVAGIVGAILLVAAMVAAAVRISGLQGAGFSDATLAVFYVLYMTLLHTITGFAALLIASKVVGRELGRAELGVARMLVAVGAFALVANLTIPIPGRIDELVLAAVAYALVVWGANRLPRVELGIVVLAHGLILIAVALGSLLDGAYASAKSELGPPTPRAETPAEPDAQAAPAPNPG